MLRVFLYRGLPNMLQNKVKTFLIKLEAFIRRDFKILLSYRFAFFLQFFGIFFSILTFFFIAKLFGGAASPYLASYGGDYFSFVLIGIAFSGYLDVAMNSFSSSIRTGQITGTLEAMLTTPTRLSTILIFSSVWNFLITSFRIILYLLIGSIVFGVNLCNMNILAAIIIQMITIICFASFGIISAGFVMVFKKGDPFTGLIARFSTLFGGVYYPITILPVWLKPISFLLPITYSLRGMRHALLQGYSIKQLMPDIWPLVLFSIILFPVSLFIFKLAVRKAKMDGTLTQF